MKVKAHLKKYKIFSYTMGKHEFLQNKHILFISPLILADVSAS